MANKKSNLVKNASILMVASIISRIIGLIYRRPLGSILGAVGLGYYSYASNVVYNTFPWPTPTDAQKARVEQTAQSILDARALYPDASLADLYDELTMPPELRKAHQANDRAVMAAYGFPVKGFTESDCVAALMKMYQELTAKEGT